MHTLKPLLLRSGAPSICIATSPGSDSGSARVSTEDHQMPVSVMSQASALSGSANRAGLATWQDHWEGSIWFGLTQLAPAGGKPSFL